MPGSSWRKNREDCGEKPGEDRHGDLRSSGLRREAQDENVSQAV